MLRKTFRDFIVTIAMHGCHDNIGKFESSGKIYVEVTRCLAYNMNSHFIHISVKYDTCRCSRWLIDLLNTFVIFMKHKPTANIL